MSEFRLHEPEFESEEFEIAWAEGYILEVLGPIKSGKEATAYLCVAHPDMGCDYLVLKRYAENVSASQGRRMYSEGRVILDERAGRAVRGKTRFGREAMRALWMGSEAEALRTLHDAGADVPEPRASAATGLLMQFIGDDGVPAPQLRATRPEPEQARAWLDRLIRNVEVFLSCHLVHADLSPFNVLVHEDRPWVIDLPQAVDARTNPGARSLLERDLRNLCTWFARYGAHETPELLAADLWDRYQRAML